MAINLDKELGKILDEYVTGVESGLDDVGDKVAKEGLKMIKGIAPRKRPKYYTGMKITTKQLGINKTFILHNEKYAGLTHLTEFSHATGNGGRTAGQPHFAPTEQFMNDEYVKGVEKLLENGKSI